MGGVYHGCKPEKDNKKASTKGVRLAPHAKWPKKIMGLYILLADDSEVNFLFKLFYYVSRDLEKKVTLSFFLNHSDSDLLKYKNSFLKGVFQNNLSSENGSSIILFNIFIFIVFSDGFVFQSSLSTG